MKSFFTNNVRRAISGSLLAVTLLGVSLYIVQAAVVITPASGGTSISIDTTSAMGGTGTYVTLTGGPVISENAVGDISAGLHTLTLPAGWEFDTTQNVTIGIGGATELALGAQVVTPSSTALSFNVSAVSTTGVATLTFSGMKVRPTTTTPSTGSITHTSGTIAGVTNGSTNFGTLSTVAGTVAKLAFTTQPGATTVYGSNLSTQPVVSSQDQFGNISTSGLSATDNVTLSLTSGTGSIVGTAMINIGTGGTNGVATFSGLQIDDIGAGKIFTAVSSAGLTSTTSTVFAITAKPLTATITVTNKAYDGNTSATITAADISAGLVYGNTVTADVTGATAIFGTSTAGTGRATSATGITLLGADAGKYTFDGTGTGTANITALPITVTASSTQAKIYGDTDPTFEYTANLSLISGNSFSGALSRAAGQNVGMYALTQGTLTAGPNYAITFVSNNFTVTARPITVTAATSTKVYDGGTTSTSTPIVTSGSLAFSDTGSFTQTYDTEDIGTGKTLTPTGTVTDGNSGNNYTVTFSPATTGIITAKPLTVTGLTAADKVYDGNATTTVSGVGALVGIVGVEDVTLGGSPVGTFSSVNVGTSTSVTVSGLTLGGLDAGNYSLTQPTLSANITPASVTVTASSTQAKIYGDTDPTFGYTSAPSLISGNSFTGLLARTAGEAVGVYAINQGTLSAGSNYTITFVPNNFSITTRPITVTASSTQSKIFGDTDPVLAYSVTSGNLSGGDTLSGSVVRVVGETAGAYAINQGTLTAGSNYALTFTSNNFTINKATPVVSWTSPSSIVYGTALSGTHLNAAASVPGTFVYTPLSGVVLNASSSHILSTDFTPTDTTNYNNVTATTTITVTKATPVVTWSNPSPLAAGVALSGTQLNASANVAGSFVYSPVSGTSFPTVGTQTLSTAFTPTDTVNYNSVASTTVTISIIPAAVSQLSITTSATTTDVLAPVTITVTGKDQFNNVVTNNSSTIVVLSADNGGALGSSLLTLTNGVATTTLSKTRSGAVNVNVSSGVVTPSQVIVTFTDSSDVTAPTPTAVTSTSTQTTGTISFTSNESGTAKVGYGLTSVHGNMTSYVAMASSTNSITLSGLVCGTTYNYSLYTKDLSGNESVTSNATFATLACTVGDVTAPTISAHTPADDSTGVAVSTSATITFSEPMDAATLNGGTLQLRKYSDDSSVAAVINYNPTSYVVTITPVTNLAYATQYYVYAVGARDTAGNILTTDYSTSTKATHEFTTGSQANGSLAVTGINTVTSTMTANDSYTSGGSWTFLVTVPTTETSLSLKFGDWVSGANSIAAANNMRVYSAQSSNATTTTSAITITAANTYSTALTLTGDLDTVTPGRQVQVTVDLKVPTTTAGGSYSTNYSVLSI